jgi:hypothetical protein
MKFKMTLSIVSALVLAVLLLLPASGCGRPVKSADNTAPATSPPVLPLIDTEVHNSVETAYFAMG